MHHALLLLAPNKILEQETDCQQIPAFLSNKCNVLSLSRLDVNTSKLESGVKAHNAHQECSTDLLRFMIFSGAYDFSDSYVISGHS